MKLQAARQLLSLLTEAIADAEVAGSKEVKLVEGAKNLDNEARQSLVDAISEAESQS